MAAYTFKTPDYRSVTRSLDTFYMFQLSQICQPFLCNYVLTADEKDKSYRNYRQVKDMLDIIVSSKTLNRIAKQSESITSMGDFEDLSSKSKTLEAGAILNISPNTRNLSQRSVNPLYPRAKISTDDYIDFLVTMAAYRDGLRAFCKITGIDHHMNNLRSSGCNTFVHLNTFRLSGVVINNLITNISQMRGCDLAMELNVDGGDGEMRMKAINSFNDNIRTSGIENVRLIPDHEYEVRILAADIYRNDVSSPAMIGIFSIVHLSEHGREITYTALHYEWGHANKMPNRKHRKDVLLGTSFAIPGEENSLPGIIETGIFLPLCRKVISELNMDKNLTAAGDRERGIGDRLYQSKDVYVDHVPGITAEENVSIRFRFRKLRPVVIHPSVDSEISPKRYVIIIRPSIGSEISSEHTRLNSFRIWQYSNIISATNLVGAGFYQESDRSKITCIECGFSVDVASLTTDVLRRHRQCSPECSFATRTSHEFHASNEGNLAEGNTSNGSGVVVDTTHNLESIGQEHSSYQYVLPTGAASHRDTSLDYSRTQANQLHNNSVIDNRRNNIPISDGPSNSNINQLTRNQARVEPQPTLTYTAQSSEYRDPSVRESTYRYWNNSSRYQEIGKLVDSGFYYTGNGDAVRCFSCDIGLADWKPHDDPWVEHARHSPLCFYLISHKGQEFINGVQEAWRRVYTPRHRRFVEVAERLRSFENAGWPTDYVRQTPEELAEAGFFYTGERDTIRCHYCDGGLRDWEPEDDPWVEHGRWFSFCKYVIEKKGIEFIRECATGNGSRPATNVPQINRNNLPTSYTVDVPVESSEEKWRKKGIENPMYTAAAMSIREMGYSNETVKMLINKYIAKTGYRDFAATDLMEIVFDLEEQGEVLTLSSTSNVNDEPHHDTDGDDNSMDGHAEPFPFSPEALLKENEVMKKKFTCMNCKVKDRTNVFLPCGHRLMCDPCARQQTKCCHCDTAVTDTVKTFLC